MSHVSSKSLLLFSLLDWPTTYLGFRKGSSLMLVALSSDQFAGKPSKVFAANLGKGSNAAAVEAPT